MPSDRDLLHRLIAQRIRQDVASMHAYAVQPSAGMIKLDAMENPYPLPADLQEALGQRLGRVAIHRYPGQSVQHLHAALLRYTQCPETHSLMLGNGSDELISLLAMACARPGTGSPTACMLAPEPGFVMYRMAATLQGLRFVGVDLRKDFSLDTPAMLQALARERPAITWLAWPNNPTANLWDKADIVRIIQACAEVNGMVVVDEAYQPFAQDSLLPLLNEHANLLILRTLSKWGLAGARLGYLLGSTALLQEFDKVRPPYNISSLNAECGLFALEHAGVFADQAQAICDQRAALEQALRCLPNATVFPSQANMILVRLPQADAVFSRLREQGVLVKNVSKLHPLLHHCLRLTVGTPEENHTMMQALRQALEAS